MKLWNRNFTLLMAATLMGAMGGIAGGFALSFLVFDETGSTLASALIVVIQLVPAFLVPLIFAPRMDHLPRKPFLVAGDALNGVIYAALGVYLLVGSFSYIGYLCVSIVLACLSSFDELAYNSIFPMLIPKGREQKGYAVSSMLYPILKVVMMPLSAVLLDTLGVPVLLMAQGALSLLAALTESRIRLVEQPKRAEQTGLRQWWADIRETAQFLRRERGLRAIYGYMAVTNGVASGYAPILVAFFRTFPGMTALMYSLFSVAEFFGRTLGGAVQYRTEIPPKKKYGFAFGVYMAYESMDMCLLWLPYPLMLVNRLLCGFLGTNSATMRQAAVQCYLPEHLRSRVNAFEGMLYTAVGAVLSLAVGALGEVLDYRLCVTLCGAFSMAVCLLTVWRSRRAVRAVYEAEQAKGEEPSAEESRPEEAETA